MTLSANQTAGAAYAASVIEHTMMKNLAEPNPTRPWRALESLVPCSAAG
jgi:hypothetical protein